MAFAATFTKTIVCTTNKRNALAHTLTRSCTENGTCDETMIWNQGVARRGMEGWKEPETAGKHARIGASKGQTHYR